MPTSQNWLKFILINLAFIIQIILIYFFIWKASIKQNWQKYRCNPWYMPLSDDLNKDFTYCVQTTQINLMGYMLQPLTYLMSNMINVGNKLTNDVNQSRGMVSLLRDNIGNVFKTLVNAFANYDVESQRLTLNLKDIASRIVGSIGTFVYILDGTQQTATSAMTGPNANYLRTYGSCFHPDTKIRLKNGTTVAMSSLKVGSYLENGDIVLATMSIFPKEKLYKLPNWDNEYTYVTGSHFIYNEDSNTFIYVKDHKLAEKQEEVSSEYYSCLITSSGKIPIGKYIFWDWEDDLLEKNL